MARQKQNNDSDAEEQRPSIVDYIEYANAIAEAQAFGDNLLMRHRLEQARAERFTSTASSTDGQYSHEASPSARRHEETVDHVNFAPTAVVHSSTKIPGASDGAISRLPHMRIFPHEEGKYQGHTECCSVCFGRLMEGVALVRMPCSHIFHITCAVEWLSRKCTCPDCRYELQTNHGRFEKGRVARMKGRKTYTCNCRPSDNHPCFLDKSLLMETATS
mmetsp:Transcript_3393/g.7112  ORF Transcript_3393/g.7112 Transcript_3393/m.7112 type:complete len:218 (+) Transcript_3393:156-809(+)|eukprot:CAMPEP_0168736468 /NCGR_PEP_ID=MMETSP0724-20121128/9877_1 /TAXON_ID=265536 /ORGANISM="Amphiprora sp., Strain CCMP467" /LENGTH=217 /DNA_ID=CAMNT_0008783669 /DNA_START=97 /DNA_END=750 /DNA_ORIENTATION=+